MDYTGWPPRPVNGAAMFKADEPSLFDAKRERSAAKDAQWRAVCNQVDKRDHYRCRACRTHVNPEGIDLLQRGHRHHLTFRSKGGQDVASNLILLCARCHDKIHVKRTLRIETGKHGADGPAAFWRFDDEGWFLSHREMAVGKVERD